MEKEFASSEKMGKIPSFSQMARITKAGQRPKIAPSMDTLRGYSRAHAAYHEVQSHCADVGLGDSRDTEGGVAEDNIDVSSRCAHVRTIVGSNWVADAFRVVACSNLPCLISDRFFFHKRKTSQADRLHGE